MTNINKKNLRNQMRNALKKLVIQFNLQLFKKWTNSPQLLSYEQLLKIYILYLQATLVSQKCSFFSSMMRFKYKTLFRIRRFWLKQLLTTAIDVSF